MLKKRIIAVFVAVTLMMTAVAVTPLVSDSLGLSMTSQAHACVSGGSSGGGC